MLLTLLLVKIDSMGNKIAIAITGASGSVYAKVLLDKLVLLKDQYEELGIVMSNNAKEIWGTELGNQDYTHYPFRYFDKYDFAAPFASSQPTLPPWLW